MSRYLDEFLRKRKRNPRQREFFQDRAGSWDENTYHDPEKVAYITGQLLIREGMDLLDVGTGTGVMIPGYLERIGDGHVTALDYSENMIEVARSKYPESERLTYRVQDLYEMKDKAAFDRVVCYSCFPHFPDPLEAIRLFVRALRPNGMLCIAHSSSGGFINSVHMGGGEEICADSLPPMDVLLEMFHLNGLEQEFVRDDEDYYIAIGRKAH